jgi:predicted RNase H-like nuclease
VITAITRFKLRPGMSRAELIEDIRHSIPAYQGRPGLVRKYICVNQEEGWGCGVYLWETREQAEAFFTVAREMIRQQTGSEPEITLLDTPVIVDNVTGEVAVAA